MQNLPVSGKNFTFPECGSCLESPIFLPTVLPYVLISLPVNSWVLWLMTSSDIFWTDRMEVSEFHLVLSEMIFGILGSPLMIIGFHFYIEMTQTVTKVINTIFTARVLFQSGVCLERYFAVVHPVLYLRYKPLRYRMSFNCFFWLTSILMALVQMSFCNRIVMCIYVSCFFVIFITSFFCYVSVLKVLKQPSPGDGGRERSNLAKRRAFNIILILEVITVIGHLPLIILSYISWNIDWDTLCIWKPLSYAVMVWFGGSHPLFYLHRAGKLTKCF